MTVRKLDENGDITTSGVQFFTGKEEIAQTISTRLKLFMGEYFRDIKDGTPWFQSILGKGQNGLGSKDAIIRRRIVQTEGVLQLTKYETDFDIVTREYKVEAAVLTELGEVPVSVSGVIEGTF
jgi:hypothetical protein